MKVQLAIKITLKGTKEPESYLFSTLRLPKATSLPFHIHSRFAISSNRQSIVFDPADGRNNRDSKTSFNVWILEQIVPPLYLSALEYLLHSSSNSSGCRFDSKRWWLVDPSDEISSVVKAAFRKLLPDANNPLFKSVDDQWISFRDAVFSGTEPSLIRDILLQLKASRFVSSYRDSGLSKISKAKVVGPDFVKQVLLYRENFLILKTCYDERRISTTDIRGILEYVVNHAPLIGLPVLIHDTDDRGKLLQLLGSRLSTIYFSSHLSHATLFSSSLFLRQGYSTEVLVSLQLDPSISVVALSDRNITALITAEISRFTSDEERNAWLDLLWKYYSSLPAPPNLKFLENANLKIVKTSFRNLSLVQCSPKEVIYDKATVKKQGLTSIAEKLGIAVLDLDPKSVIGEYLSKLFPDKLIVNFLLCLQEKPIGSFNALTQAESQHLAKWLRENIYWNIADWHPTDPGIRKSFLLQLPIWIVYRDQQKQRLSASGVSVLPGNFPAEDLISYMEPATSIAPFSSELVALLEYDQNWQYGKFSCMSAGDIMDAVSLPAKLEASTDFDRLKPFVRSVFQLPTRELELAGIRLPVGDGTLRRVNELYDHTVNLFVKTLKYTQRPSFLHERFRDLSRTTLRNLGMTYTIDLASFRFCALEVQRLSGGPQRDSDGYWPDTRELLEMSRTCFNVYKGELARLFMTKTQLWASLDEIAFIRPKDVRRQRASYDWRMYFDGSLPTVLPPSRFVRPSLEPIAWTQRYLCFFEPAAELLAVNTTFGAPHVSEVVCPSVFIHCRKATDWI